jgi:hypothetical protein
MPTDLIHRIGIAGISNPNGIPSISPALTRSGYAGFTSPQTTNNPNGVASTSRRNLIQPLQG